MSEAIDEIVDGLEETPEEPQEEVKAEAPEVKEEVKEESRANQRIRQLIEDKKSLESRLEKLETLKEQVESLAKSREPEKVDPDFMQDPKGYVDTQSKKVQEAIEKLERQAKEGSEKAQQQLAQMQFMQGIQSDESNFIRENPDYYTALNYLREQRKAELEELGIDDDEAIQIINKEELQIAAIALNKGTSAAAHVYSRAKKLGYAKNQDTSELDEAAERMTKAQRAQSMGGSNIPEERSIEEPEDEAWAPIEEAFEELFGSKLR